MIAEHLERLAGGESIGQGLKPMDLRRIHVGRGAIRHLLPVARELAVNGRIVILQDETVILSPTGELKAEVLEELEAVGEVAVVTLPGWVHADERTVAIAVAGCRGADVVVSVGSGTICDIGKVAAQNAAHVVVQTAASVDGYADDQSVLLRSGVKRTTHSGWPFALIIDSGVLASAPRELNRSGLGDAITMFTAPADWHLAHRLGMVDGFNQATALVARAYGEELLTLGPGIDSCDEDSLELLGSLLALRGIAMGVSGQTSPGSGMEHTVSHLLDMLAGVQGKPNSLHGAQVGIATIVVSKLWRRVVDALESGTLGTVVLPPRTESERRVRTAFLPLDSSGAMGDECWADYSTKFDRMITNGVADRVADLRASGADFVPVLRGIITDSDRLEAALRDAGAPVRFSDLPTQPTIAEVNWAFANCHLMRSRFTVADLAAITGMWTAGLISELVAESY